MVFITLAGRYDRCVDTVVWCARGFNYAGFTFLLGFLPYCLALLRVPKGHNIHYRIYFPLLAQFFEWRFYPLVYIWCKIFWFWLNLLNLFCSLKIVRKCINDLKLKGMPDISWFTENEVSLIRLPPPPPIILSEINKLGWFRFVVWYPTRIPTYQPSNSQFNSIIFFIYKYSHSISQQF